MQYGHYHLQGTYAFLLVNINRYATAIVLYANGIAGQNSYLYIFSNSRPAPRQSNLFYHLVYQVVQAAVAGVANMYMAGRLRTASNPSNTTCILLAESIGLLVSFFHAHFPCCSAHILLLKKHCANLQNSGGFYPGFASFLLGVLAIFS